MTFVMAMTIIIRNMTLWAAYIGKINKKSKIRSKHFHIGKMFSLIVQEFFSH